MGEREGGGGVFPCEKVRDALCLTGVNHGFCQNWSNSEWSGQNVFSHQGTCILRIAFEGGDPKSWNDGMAEQRNGRIMEWQKMTPNPKRRNCGKFPKILKQGMMENPPKN